MNKINISVIGACVTRDIFNSKFVSDYKDYYNVVSSCYQTSLISIMSNTIKIQQNELIGNIQPHQKLVLDKDINKIFLEELKISNPKYIIIDFYADIRYGVLKIGSNYITNNPNHIKKTNFYKEKKFDYQYNLTNNTELYYEIFKKSFQSFFEYIKNNLPNTKLLVHKIRFTDVYKDKSGNKKVFYEDKYKYIDLENKLSSKFYEYIQQNYDVTIVDMSEVEYLADSNHIWGLYPYHYEIKYHNDFINKLNKICLKDLLMSK